MYFTRIWFFCCAGGDDEVVALNSAGERTWTSCKGTTSPGLCSITWSPVCKGLIVGGLCQYLCLDTATGNVLWVKKHDYPSSSSIEGADKNSNIVIGCSGTNDSEYLIAIDGFTGRTVWTWQSEEAEDMYYCKITSNGTIFAVSSGFLCAVVCGK